MASMQQYEYRRLPGKDIFRIALEATGQVIDAERHCFRYRDVFVKHLSVFAEILQEPDESGRMLLCLLNGTCDKISMSAAQCQIVQRSLDSHHEAVAPEQDLQASYEDHAQCSVYNEDMTPRQVAEKSVVLFMQTAEFHHANDNSENLTRACAMFLHSAAEKYQFKQLRTVTFDLQLLADVFILDKLATAQATGDAWTRGVRFLIAQRKPSTRQLATTVFRKASFGTAFTRIDLARFKARSTPDAQYRDLCQGLRRLVQRASIVVAPSSNPHTPQHLLIALKPGPDETAPQLRSFMLLKDVLRDGMDLVRTQPRMQCTLPPVYAEVLQLVSSELLPTHPWRCPVGMSPDVHVRLYQTLLERLQMQKLAMDFAKIRTTS